MRVDLSKPHCVYLTRHPEGLIYVGKGKTVAVANGNYKGSGILLNRLFEHDGYEYETWATSIVRTFDAAPDAFDYERQLIAMTRANLGSLNLAEGGAGGKGFTGKKHTPETKQRMSISAIKMAEQNAALCAKRSDVLKKTWREKRDARIASMNTAESIDRRKAAALKRVGWKANPASVEAKRKPCTVDGFTIYPSRKALVDALGAGKFGFRSPTFRYL